jgi:hypothetical protein
MSKIVFYFNYARRQHRISDEGWTCHSVEEDSLEVLDSNGYIEIVLMYCMIGLVSETKLLFSNRQYRTSQEVN